MWGRWDGGGESKVEKLKVIGHKFEWWNSREVEGGGEAAVFVGMMVLAAEGVTLYGCRRRRLTLCASLPACVSACAGNFSGWPFLSTGDPQMKSRFVLFAILALAISIGVDAIGEVKESHDSRMVTALCRIQPQQQCETVACVVTCVGGVTSGPWGTPGKFVCFCDGNNSVLDGSA